MGITEVARLAAITFNGACVTITSAFNWTSSAINSGERSKRPSAQRYAIATFLPSAQPSSPSLCTRAAVD
jgi:hypothetical protein